MGSVFILVAFIGLYYTDVRDYVDAAWWSTGRRSRSPADHGRGPRVPHLEHSGPPAGGQGQPCSACTAGGRHWRRPERKAGEPGGPTPPGKIELYGRGVDPQAARVDQPFFRPTYQYLLFAFCSSGSR